MRLKVIERGYFSKVEIYGKEWGMAKFELNIMEKRQFYYWPYFLKTINPQPYSCQRCKNRPVDFRLSGKRKFTPKILPCPIWWWTKSAPFFDNPNCECGEWDES